MAVSAPLIQWPLQLIEQGPKKDPTILLEAEAKVGDVAFKVMALRVKPDGRGPDYDDGVDEREYDGSLESMIEDLEDLAKTIQPAVVEINGSHYVLWMAPTSKG